MYTAFGTDPFIAWKQFVGWWLEPSETVDVYLADLRRLGVPFGRAIDHILECAFLAGLPDDVSQLLRASSRLDELGMNKLLAWAWNILKDTEQVEAAARTTETPSERLLAAGDSAMPRPRESPKCYRCGDVSHYSRDCRSWGNTGGANDQKTRERLRCHCCKRLGHIVRNCSGNRSRDKVPLLALLSPAQWMWHYSWLRCKSTVCSAQRSSTRDVPGQ